MLQSTCVIAMYWLNMRALGFSVPPQGVYDCQRIMEYLPLFIMHVFWNSLFNLSVYFPSCMLLIFLFGNSRSNNMLQCFLPWAFFFTDISRSSKCYFFGKTLLVRKLCRVNLKYIYNSLHAFT